LATPQNHNDVLEDLATVCRQANVAHLRATDSFTWRNYTLSVTTAIISTVVGSTVYATVHGGSLRFAVASLSVAAAGLAAIQNVLR
jgi:hypothetical protein